MFVSPDFWRAAEFEGCAATRTRIALLRGTLKHVLSLTLGPHGEELVAAHLRTGRYHSAEEVVTRALESLAAQEPLSPRKRTPAEAVDHIRESRKGVTLGDLKIKDLIHEGHKY